MIGDSPLIQGLKPYVHTSDTQLPWLGGVPAHWHVQRAKSLLRPIDIRSTTGDEELLTVSSERGVVPRRTAAVTMFKAESYVGYKLCWPGDLVINSLWAWSRGLGVSSHHGIVSSAYGVYRSRSTQALSPRYLHYLVRSHAFNWELHVRSKGVWISRLQLTDDAFLNAPLVVPPLQEQAAIVRFLDYIDGRIRGYIRAKKKLISLLQERKQAIIQRAVTCGLTPSASVQVSGVSWLGDVPGHWAVMPLKRKWTIVDCKHLTVPFVEDGVPLASVREVQKFDLDLSAAKRTTPPWYSHLVSGGRQPQRGDLVYCRNVSVGSCAYVDTDTPFAMGQDVCLIRSHSESGGFLNYFMHSPAMKRQLSLVLIGSTFDRINVSEVKSLVIVVPPREEQDAIVAYLDRQMSSFDEPVRRAEREIALMREYHTRLISDAVTGKVDVRAAAATLPCDSEGSITPHYEEDLLSGDAGDEAECDAELVEAEA